MSVRYYMHTPCHAADTCPDCSGDASQGLDVQEDGGGDQLQLGAAQSGISPLLVTALPRRAVLAVAAKKPARRKPTKKRKPTRKRPTRSLERTPTKKWRPTQRRTGRPTKKPTKQPTKATQKKFSPPPPPAVVLTATDYGLTNLELTNCAVLETGNYLLHWKVSLHGQCISSPLAACRILQKCRSTTTVPRPRLLPCSWTVRRCAARCSPSFRLATREKDSGWASGSATRRTAMPECFKAMWSWPASWAPTALRWTTTYRITRFQILRATRRQTRCASTPCACTTL